MWKCSYMFFIQVNNELCCKLDIKRPVTTSYHPQTNGLDERTDQTLNVHLAKLVNEHLTNWDCYLEDVAFSITTQRQATTKYTPFFLFGRNARTPMEVNWFWDCWWLFLSLMCCYNYYHYFCYCCYRWSLPPSSSCGLKWRRRTSCPWMGALQEQVAIFHINTFNNSSYSLCKCLSWNKWLSVFLSLFFCHVSQNVEQAQQRQKEQFAKRKAKGVMSFTFAPGDHVLWCIMKNNGRKGGETGALWTGPYR